MKTIRKPHAFLSLGVFVALIACWSCDPNQALDKYFRDMGLTRLKYARDDIKVGGLVFCYSKSGPVYVDNIVDYRTNASGKTPVDITSGITEYNAKLSSYTGSRDVDSSIAATFLDSILPVKLSATLKLISAVTIDPTDAIVERLKIPDANLFLRSSDSDEVTKYIDAEIASEKAVPYLIYETFSAKSLKLESSGSTDITGNANLNSAATVISQGDAKIEISKTSKTSLLLTGNKYYRFTLRTGRLKKAIGGRYIVEPGTFIPKGALGGKDGVSYSKPLIGNFDPVDIKMKLRNK